MHSRDRMQLPAAAVLAAAAAVAWWRADFFTMELLAEIAILAIFTMSLQILVGTTGMVSLGHAGFLAAGAYSTAAATLFLGWPPAAALVLSTAVAALLAAAVGVFVIRLSGVFFIMITLAVGQMFHAFLFRAKLFGGDNGLAGTPRFDLAPLGLDAADSGTFAALALLGAALVYLLLLRLTRSPFGMMLAAIHQNESRLASLGCPVRRYKLAAFAAAGAGAGVAGGLTAQHTGFISPDLAFWTFSGEALIIVILGGSGSLAGAAAGAALFVLLRDLFSTGSFWSGLLLPPELASRWQLVMGLLFIAVVLAARDGLYGRLVWLIEALYARRRMPR